MAQLDLEESELRRTLYEIHAGHGSFIGSAQEGKMEAKGIWADYNSGLDWMSTGKLTPQVPPCASHHVILFMGSTLGNIPRLDAQALLNRIVDTGMRPGDMILVGLDQCQDADLVINSYSDADGLATELYRNGMYNAAKQAHIEGLLNPEDFEYYAVYDHDEHCHKVRLWCSDFQDRSLIVYSSC